MGSRRVPLSSEVSRLLVIQTNPGEVSVACPLPPACRPLGTRPISGASWTRTADELGWTTGPVSKKSYPSASQGTVAAVAEGADLIRGGDNVVVGTTLVDEPFLASPLNRPASKSLTTYLGWLGCRLCQHGKPSPGGQRHGTVSDGGEFSVTMAGSIWEDLCV